MGLLSVFTCRSNIEPDDDDACIDDDGNTVVIFGSDGSGAFAALNVSEIDLSSLVSTGLGAPAGSKLTAHLEDVNGDGIDDLVVEFEDEDEDSVLGGGPVTITLTGALLDGTPIDGTQEVCVEIDDEDDDEDDD